MKAVKSVKVCVFFLKCLPDVRLADIGSQCVLLDSGVVRPCEPMQFLKCNVNVHVATEETNIEDNCQKKRWKCLSS